MKVGGSKPKSKPGKVAVPKVPVDRPVPNPSTSPLVQAASAKHRIGVRKAQVPQAVMGKGILATTPKTAAKPGAGKTAGQKAKPTNSPARSIAAQPHIDQSRATWKSGGKHF